MNTTDQLTRPSTYSNLPWYHHTANDISLVPLELLHSNRGSVLKAREAYLIARGNTSALGVNKIGET